MLFILLTLTVLWLTYKWSVNSFDYFEKIGVPFEKPVPLFGNMLNFVLQKESLVDAMQRGYDKFKKSKLFGFFTFKQASYVIADPEIIKKITTKDFDHFVNHNDAISHSDKVFGRTLLALRDKEWRGMRTTLSPIFTSSKMKMMFELLSEQAQDFTSFYEERARNGEKLVVDTLDTFARFTADGISTAVLGFKADCVRNPDSEVFSFTKKLLHEFSGLIGNLKITMSIGMPKFYQFLGLNIMSKESYEFFHRVVIDAMNERDLKKISRPDVIQLLLQAKKGQLQKEQEVNEKDEANFAANIEYDVGTKKNASNFTDIDWVAQGFIFFGAGFDTTSNLLNYTCYELARNPEIQQQLQREIDEVALTLRDSNVTYEALHKMQYLDMVVSESLRKRPPAPQTDRTCSRDYDMDLGNGNILKIKKGDLIFLPFYQIHNDPEYYPNPEKFDPLRFSDENKDSILPGSYLPFGIGPRMCIGSRYALMEAKLLLFTFLRRFSVFTCDKTPEKLSYGANLNFKLIETVFLQFKLRE